jgi:hypothetical protein
MKSYSCGTIYLPSAFSSGLEALYSMSVSERREEQEESSPSETEPRKPLFTARSNNINGGKESSPADTKPR